jgi:hypothetical protein
MTNLKAAAARLLNQRATKPADDVSTYGPIRRSLTAAAFSSG